MTRHLSAHSRLFSAGISVLTLCPSALHADILFPNADFEAGTLVGWTAEGTAFSTRQPTKGDNSLVRGAASSNLQGQYWIGTFENYDGLTGSPGNNRGDPATGTLTSQEFTIAKRYINFRIAGGGNASQLGVKLLCEGQEYLMSTGRYAEYMVAASYDAAALAGKVARVVVYDQATGGWGHINVDDFTATDEPVPQGDGGFAFVPGIPLRDDPTVGYGQPQRPQFHFSSRTNHLNDPNGMVFDGEKYHLFYQHDPLSVNGGNQTWGHATSPDMIRWEQRDFALRPYTVDGTSGLMYSGTAVVDFNNSLGVQVGETKTLVAFYTFAAAKAAFYQAMAYSTDGGVTWQYHNHGRAVVPNQGFDNGERDPKVFWHEPSQRWVMILWVQNNPGRVRFFNSNNLKDWTFASDLLRDWAFECMDYFLAPVDGDPNNMKAVIYDASFDYEIGTFDGTTFHTEAGPFHASRGNFYAAQSFNQLPGGPGGRTVQMGWMIGGPNPAVLYGTPHNQQMSFPSDLTLKTTPDGVRLCSWPVPEIETLVTGTTTLTSQPLTPSSNLLDGMTDLDLVDLSIDFSPGTATEIAIDLPRTLVRYHVATGVLTHNGADVPGTVVTVDSPLPPRDGHVKLRLLLDRITLEAYAFEGDRFGSHYIRPDGGTAVPSIRSIGGNATVHSLVVKKLKSSWPEESGLSTSLVNPGFENGNPADAAFHNPVAGWQGFGDWADASGIWNDTGDRLKQSAGYPDFTGIGAGSLKARNGALENNAGLFQSLGKVSAKDVGKTFTLGADLGARITDGAQNYAHSGLLTVSFRKGVTTGIPGGKGTFVGTPGTSTVTADDADLPSLDKVALVRKSASFTPTVADVGTEIFAVIDLHNQSNTPAAASGEKQYIVDNVTLTEGGSAVLDGLMASEGFDYPAGNNNLTGKNGGTGWNGVWQTVNGASANLTAGSLVAGTSAVTGYDAHSTGNRANLPNNRRVGRQLDVSPDGPFSTAGLVDAAGRIGADGKTVYLSFLQQPSATGSYYEFEFHRGHLGDSGRIAGIGNDQGGTNVNLRAPDTVHTAIGAGTTAVNFYVVRIDFKPGNDDVYIYRNPTSATEPGTPTLLKTGAADMSFDGISLAAFVSDRTVVHDEIRIGATWKDVTDPPAFPAISLQPRSTVSYVGATLVLTSSVTGFPVPAIQWFKNGVAIPGQTAATLTLTNIETPAAGQYSFTATNTLGAVTSDTALVIVQAPPAGLLAYEGCDYQEGTANLPGKAGGLGWGAPWAAVNGAGGSVLSGNLAGGMAPEGYDKASSGNKILISNGRRDGRMLETTPAGRFGAVGLLDGNGRIGADGKTLYLSFLQQPNGSTYFYEFELHRDNLGDTGRIAGVGNDRPGTNVNLRTGITHTLIGPGNADVNFYVVRIDFKPGNDNVRVYQNPVSSTEPAVATLSMPNALDMSFNGISLGAFENGRTVTHDEIRMGTTWASVAGNLFQSTPFATWAATNGLDGSFGKDLGFDSDPDMDGIPNGLEWVLGGNPLAPGGPALISSTRDASGNLALTFTRAESALGAAALAAQWSTTLEGIWNDVPVTQFGGTYPGGIAVTVEQGPTPDTVVVTIPAQNAPNEKLFARLRASLP